MLLCDCKSFIKESYYYYYYYYYYLLVFSSAAGSRWVTLVPRTPFGPWCWISKDVAGPSLCLSSVLVSAELDLPIADIQCWHRRYNAAIDLPAAVDAATKIYAHRNSSSE